MVKIPVVNDPTGRLAPLFIHSIKSPERCSARGYSFVVRHHWVDKPITLRHGSYTADCPLWFGCEPSEVTEPTALDRLGRPRYEPEPPHPASVEIWGWRLLFPVGRNSV